MFEPVDERTRVQVAGEEPLRLAAAAVRQMDADNEELVRLTGEIRQAQARLFDNMRKNLEAIVRAMGLEGHWRMDATHFKDLRLAVLVPSSGSSTDAFEGVDMARAN